MKIQGQQVRVEVVETSASGRLVELRVAILDGHGRELCAWLPPILSVGESFTVAPLDVTVEGTLTEN